MARRTDLRLEPHEIQVRRPPPGVIAATPLWTDDYSDLLGAMRLLGKRTADSSARQWSARP